MFLAERLKCFGRTFHRTCFKCARCGTQLSTANCYETESHAFCCEVCPDEEAPERGDSSSDDEQQDSAAGSYDEYSINLECALEVAPLSDPALSAFLNTQLSHAEPITVTSSPALPTISNNINNITQDSHNSLQESLRSNDDNNLNCSTLIKEKDDSENQSGGQKVNKDLNSCDGDSIAQTIIVSNKVKVKNSDVVGNSSLCSNSIELRRNSSGESINSSLVSRRKSLFENLTQAEDISKVCRKSSRSSVTAQEDCTSLASTANDSDVNNTFLVSSDDTTTEENKKAQIKEEIESQAEDVKINVKSDVDINLNGNLDIPSIEVEESSMCSQVDKKIDATQIVVIPQLKVDHEVEEGKVEIPSIKLEEDDDKNKVTTIIEPEESEEGKVEIPSIKLEEDNDDKHKVKTVIEPEEEEYPEDLNPFGDEEETKPAANKSSSTNPFGSDSEEEEEPTLRNVQPSPRKVIPVDAHLNPFWEEGQDEEEQEKPVPRPRSLRCVYHNNAMQIISSDQF